MVLEMASRSPDSNVTHLMVLIVDVLVGRLLSFVCAGVNFVVLAHLLLLDVPGTGED